MAGEPGVSLQGFTTDITSHMESLIGNYFSKINIRNTSRGMLAEVKSDVLAVTKRTDSCARFCAKYNNALILVRFNILAQPVSAQTSYQRRWCLVSRPV